FRIDRSRNRIWKGYARRRRGRWYFNAPIEAPDVTAAVPVVDEGNAFPLPFDRCVIFVCHSSFLKAARADCTRGTARPKCHFSLISGPTLLPRLKRGSEEFT